MSRFVIAMLLWLTATATAAPSQVAVLPIDAVTTDAESARVAAEITAALRIAQVAHGTILVAASPREIAAAKHAAQCKSEAVACMTALGTALGADLVVYGKVQHRSTAGYQITLKLLHVGKRRVVMSVIDLIANKNASGPQLAAEVRRLYAKLAR